MPSPVVERVRERGRCSFRDFVELALYDPDVGYYATGRVRIGTNGDFSTSATIHPLFGEIVAAWAEDVWRALGLPERFTFVEIGPGDGWLTRDALTALAQRPEGEAPDVGVLLVERSPALRERQRATLAAFARRVEWTSLDRLAASPLTGVVVSNELVDALPFHRVRLREGRLDELFVEASGERLVPVWDVVRDLAVREYVARYVPAPAEDRIVDVCPDALTWMRDVAACLASGAVLTADYGATAEQLYGAGGRGDTARGFRAHRLLPDVLSDPDADITSDVNFSALVDAARSSGLEAVSFESQASFLRRYDLVNRIARRVASGDSLSSALAMKSLLTPGGISDAMRVLVLARAVPETVKLG